MRRVVVLHYGEIGLKGKNRVLFERALATNLRAILGKVRKVGGRFVADVELSADQIKRLKLLPGVEYFAPAIETKAEMTEIENGVLDLLSDRSFETFAIAASRADKQFELTSPEINAKIGARVVELTGKKVRLSRPDVKVRIEVCRRHAYIYTDRYDGIGGLPVGVSGRVVGLLSGGIDSPVACFLAMKRGCEVVFVHFFNQTFRGGASVNRARQIVERLAQIQLGARFWIVPFGELQRAIIENVPARYRTLIYRRFMLRLANAIAEKEGALALITGDSIGQVASQTLANLSAVYAVSQRAVLTPLAGTNKSETIEIAKKIGTYEISILPYEDCCSLMVARHPETRANADQLDELERNIPDAEELMRRCLSSARCEIQKVPSPVV